jgi:tRNA(Ile)-lysidine synthase
LSFDIAEKKCNHGFKRLLLAVSGGLDSICLAHYFIENQKILGIEWLGIAHVHHGLREGSADRDAAFVETFAKSRDVPFFLKKLDGEALKAAEGSLEENARDARYKALVDVVVKSAEMEMPAQGGHDNNDCEHGKKIAIVTAHHAGDQAETMFMRIKRGTTLAGLRGIQEVRVMPAPFGHVQGPFIYRPFLNVTRAELLEYAREHNLSWCEDESNTDVKFARNKIRHDLLPQLERDCPGTMAQLCRIAGIADKAYAKVMRECENVFGAVLCTDIEERQSPNKSGMTSFIALDKKKLNKILQAHKDADLSEMFRLWLSEKGFRFPIGFFYATKEPAHVKIPVRTVYRKRSIVKIRHTVWICEFKDALSAAKFVSCEMKEKDYNEST